MGEIFARARPAKLLPWTGERLTHGAGMQVELEHLHRYFLARHAASGLDVLDVAAGEGYGSAFLAQTARSVVGMDCDSATVTHAAAAYGGKNLRFIAGDMRCLPLPDATFDLVVSFESIEHIREHEAFLREVRRVLRPGGRLLLSTPERDTYSPAGQPANPYHLRELSRAEFGALLRGHFRHVTVQGQRPLLGSAIFSEDPAGDPGLLSFERRGPDRFEASAGLPRATYLLAQASDTPLTALPGSLYVETGAVQDAVQSAEAAAAACGSGELEAEIKGLRATVAALRRQLNEAHATRQDLWDARAERDDAQSRLAQADDERTALRARLSEAQLARDALRSRLTEAESYGGHVTAEFQKAAAALAEGAAYARRLEVELAQQHARIHVIEPELRDMRLSSCWQATKPLRRMAQSYPVTRRLLRATVAAMPWVKSGAPALSPAVAVTRSSPLQQAQDKDRLTVSLRDALGRFLSGQERLAFPRHEAPDLSVLVAVWNQAHFTLHCLKALLAQRGVTLEVVLVDNASTDATAELLDRLEGVRIIRNPINQGFVRATNQAAAAARGRHLLMLNSDAFPRPDSLAAALATLDSEPGIGAVGGRLILPSGVLQEAGCIVWTDGSTLGYGRGLAPEASEAMFRRDVDYCSGAFLLTPRATWLRLGGLDDAYAPAYYEEADYCMRLREAGLRVVYEPAAAVDHYEFGSEAKRGDASVAMERNARHFRERHAAALRSHHLPFADRNLLEARISKPSRQRRLLMIDDTLPLQMQGSGLPRARALLSAAIAAGWSVTHYPLHPLDVDWDTLRHELPPGVEAMREGGLARLGRFLAERQDHYNAVLVSRPHNMDQFQRVLAAQPGVLGKAKILYDAEALYALRDVAKAALDGQPMDETEADRLVAQEVRRCTAGVSAVTCVTVAEFDLFRRHVPDGMPLFRLAHAAAMPATTPDHAFRRGFLFVGRLLEQDSPNWRGLAWFLRECWPLLRQALPDAELTVAGQLHPDHAVLAVPGVRLLGGVAKLQPLYDAARVFIAPVRFAAGVPIKIVDATAGGLPTATTTLMARQLGWQDQGALAVADEPAALVAQAVALHQDAAAWKVMQDRARALLQRDFAEAGFNREMAAALESACAPAMVSARPSAGDAHRVARVNAVWSNALPHDMALRWATYPMAHPVVAAELNRRATGRPDHDGYGALRELLLSLGHSLPLERAASLCCGTGDLERRLAGEGLIARCTGYDLAAGALEVARAEAHAAGQAAALTYVHRDLEAEPLDEEGLDLVVGHQGVHHLSRLEYVFDNVHAALRSGGIFHLHEFVGPDRFQWTDRQMAEITAWLRSVPERYRYSASGALKIEAGRPRITEMLAHDPSEAVRSSAIERLVTERFEVLVRRPLGCTLAMMALADIAQNFDPAIPEDVEHLERLLRRESELMASGEIGSDLLIITARKRN